MRKSFSLDTKPSRMFRLTLELTRRAHNGDLIQVDDEMQANSRSG
jgi:hypothetical protein